MDRTVAGGGRPDSLKTAEAIASVLPLLAANPAMTAVEITRETGLSVTSSKLEAMKRSLIVMGEASQLMKAAGMPEISAKIRYVVTNPILAKQVVEAAEQYVVSQELPSTFLLVPADQILGDQVDDGPVAHAPIVQEEANTRGDAGEPERDVVQHAVDNDAVDVQEPDQEPDHDVVAQVNNAGDADVVCDAAPDRDFVAPIMQDADNNVVAGARCCGRR